MKLFFVYVFYLLLYDISHHFSFFVFRDERRDYIIAKYVEKRFMLKPKEKVINESSENSTESHAKVFLA